MLCHVMPLQTDRFSAVQSFQNLFKIRFYPEFLIPCTEYDGQMHGFMCEVPQVNVTDDSKYLAFSRTNTRTECVSGDEVNRD